MCHNTAFEKMNSTIKEINNPSVIIVGGGAAGLSAAYQLIQNGLKNVVILEAAERIGGRVLTVPFGANSDNIVELGANWIHGGVISNPVYTQAIQNKLLDPHVFKLNRKVGLYYTSSGKIIDEELAFKAFDIFMKIDYEASHQENLSRDLTMEEYLNKRLQQEIESFSINEQKSMKQVFNCLRNFLCFHIGDSLDKISIKEYGQYHEMPGGDVKLPKGFLKILKRIAKKLPQETIYLKKRVTNINWDPMENKISVTCENSFKAYADHVIVTVSLGCLKSYCNTLFTPALPLEKKEAIFQLGFGRVNKIFLYYKQPFWLKGFESIHLAWEDDEFRCIDVSDWVKCIFAFDEVLNNSNVLVAWIAGPGAEVMEKLSKKQIMTDCTKILRQFTNNPFIPQPSNIVHSSWCSNPLILGSYSYIPIHISNGVISKIAKPLPSQTMPKLLFAGEATHEHYFSTVHGAMLSGIREADRIIKFYRKFQPKL